jgi:uncharacterized YigZ family protein
MSSYPIPAAEARAEIRVVNSRFIASAAPAPSVEAAKAFVERVRAELPNASHHVYAFLVGHGASVTAGMSDAGEPSGTAGRPALAVLRGSGLGDVAVVITRFFGGTLLGTGGLVRAYGDAVKAVLAELSTTEKVELVTLLVSLPYPAFGACKLLLPRYSAVVDAEEFAADVTLTLSLPQEQAGPLAEALREATAGAAVVVEA